MKMSLDERFPHKEITAVRTETGQVAIRITYVTKKKQAVVHDYVMAQDIAEELLSDLILAICTRKPK